MNQTPESIEFIFRKAPSQDRYLLKLIAHGRHLGFDNFINRKLIWPFLLNLKYDQIEDQPAFEWKSNINRNSIDYQQLQKDAERSLSSMKTFENINKIHLKKRQNDVLMILDNFFGHNPQLRYIQGFHDVASVFLTIFGNNIGYYMMQRAGVVYFHDFLKFDVGHIGIVLSQITLDLVVRQDKDFEEIFACFKQSKFLIFIIPWIFTWFSHVFSSLKTICRIWDYILCTGPFGAIYLTAGIILSSKQDLLKHCEQFDEANIQSFYQKQARQQSLNIENSIKKAIQVEEKTTIELLPGYKKLKDNSMFRLQNFYKQLELLERHHNYIEEKKRKQQINKIIKTAILVATTATLSYVLIRYSGSKNIFKTLGFTGEL